MRVYLDKIGHSFGGQTIFRDVTFEIFPGRKTVLVGANGSGKTTLFRIIAGVLEPETGKVIMDKGRVALVEQEFTLAPDCTLLAACAEVFGEIHALGETLRRMEADFASLTPAEHDRYTLLHDRFESSGGWDWERRIETVLVGIGFSRDDFQRPVSGFSGGQRRRLLLARALLKNPDLLLLDEPTNHLDLEAIAWLESWLEAWKGGLVFISHDRHFMDRVAQEVVELSHGGLERYPAPFDVFRAERARRREARLKEYAEQQAFIKKNEEFIRRNIAGQKTKQAQSRRRMLEKIELLEPPRRDASFRLQIRKDTREGHRVLEAEGLSFAYGGGPPVLRDVGFTLYRGERIGLLGRNGSGKSTLLKMAAGLLAPDGGRITLDERVTLGYFPQEGGALDPGMRALDAIWEVIPAEPEVAVRNILGGFLFSDEEAEKRIGLMSGGEKSRVLLVKLMLSRPNFLVMDEPTNHLDLPSRILLENMLVGYDGTVLLVSHDRAFLDEVVTAVYHVGDGHLVRYEGNVSDNLARILPEETPAATVVSTRAQEETLLPPEERVRQAGRGANRYKIGKLEERIAALEEERKGCEQEMLSEAATRDGRIFREVENRHTALGDELTRLYREWEELCGT